MKKLMNLDFLTCCLTCFCCSACYNIMLLYYTFEFFYSRLHAIHQIVLIISLLRYPDPLTIKKLINLDSLPNRCHRTIVLLCGTLSDLLHLCSHATHQIVLTIIFLIYRDLLTIKKLINLDCLARCLARFTV